MIESRVEKKLAELKAKASLPLAIELWNGKRYALSERPKVTVKVAGASALKDLANPDLATLGEAYVEGRIDVDGPIDEALRRHEERLRPAILKLQERSRKMGALFVPASPLSFHLRNFALRHMPRAWLGQYFINAIRSEILATSDAS